MEKLFGATITSVLLITNACAQTAAEHAPPALPTSADAAVTEDLTLKVGGQLITVPPPAGLTYVPKANFAKLYETMQSSQPAGNHVEALYFDAQEFEKMKQGKLADASHHAMLYTSEALAGPLSFGKFATTLKSALIKAGQGQASKGFEKGLAEAEAKRKGTGMGWHLQGFQPVHSQGDYYISISAMMEDGTGNSMATTMNLVLAKSHLINLVTYENHVTEESKAIKASREASAAWVSSVLAANPVSAAEQERDRASLLESNFSFKMDYAVGLVVGFLLMLGAFWPLKRLGRKA